MDDHSRGIAYQSTRLLFCGVFARLTALQSPRLHLLRSIKKGMSGKCNFTWRSRFGLLSRSPTLRLRVYSRGCLIDCTQWIFVDDRGLGGVSIAGSGLVLYWGGVRFRCGGCVFFSHTTSPFRQRLCYCPIGKGICFGKFRNPFALLARSSRSAACSLRGVKRAFDSSGRSVQSGG